MATNFPTSKDDLDPTRGTAGDTLGTPNHITHHQNEDDAIEAIQDKVGIDSSADATSLDYQVNNVLSIDPGHLHTINNISDVDITSPITGEALLYNSVSGNWENSTSATPDASTGTKGITTMSVAPAAPATPIAVGDNDGRVPTQGENDALVGNEGTPSTTNTYVTEDYMVFFAGIIVPYGGSTAPGGWLLCDGTTGLNSTTDLTLADLYAVIGTTFGGTGAADFDLPDMRGNFPLGKDNMGGVSRNRVTHTNADTVGAEEGAETHTLVESEMPAHTHVQNLSTSAGAVTVATGVASRTIDTNGPATDSTGGDGAHENMSPYMTLNYLIKK